MVRPCGIAVPLLILNPAWLPTPSWPFPVVSRALSLSITTTWVNTGPLGRSNSSPIWNLAQCYKRSAGAVIGAGHVRPCCKGVGHAHFGKQPGSGLRQLLVNEMDQEPTV